VLDQQRNLRPATCRSKFLPIKWEKLLLKLNARGERGMEKGITFEFSHFMSPNSVILPRAGFTAVTASGLGCQGWQPPEDNTAAAVVGGFKIRIPDRYTNGW